MKKVPPITKISITASVIGLILLFFFSFLAFGNYLSNNEFKEELSNHNGEAVFSLKCPDYKNRPVIAIEDSGEIFYFEVDTGFTYSYINPNGFKKCKHHLEKNTSLEDIRLNLDIEDKRYLTDGKKHQISMPVKKSEVFSEKYIDGLLGQDFLTQYDNVVFDYKENKLRFNQMPVNNHPVKMYKTPGNCYCIYYTLDGIKDFGLLDTGCNSFVVRENYKTDYIELSEEEKNKILEQTQVVKQKMETIHFEQVKIGEQTYNEIEGVYWLDKNLTGYPSSEKENRILSLLGSTFYKDHIIQLDYKNSLFYIE